MIAITIQGEIPQTYYAETLEQAARVCDSLAELYGGTYTWPHDEAGRLVSGVFEITACPSVAVSIVVSEGYTPEERRIHGPGGIWDRARLEGVAAPPAPRGPWPEPDLTPETSDVIDLIADSFYTNNIEQVCIPRWARMDARLDFSADRPPSEALHVWLNGTRFVVHITPPAEKEATP